MIVLDAGVVIAHLGRDDSHWGAAFEILETDDKLGIHPITLAESLVHSARSGEESLAVAKIVLIGVVEVIPPHDEPLLLARLRADTRLKMPDCCVLAAALQNRGTVATFDRRLADAARSIGLDVVGA